MNATMRRAVAAAALTIAATAGVGSLATARADVPAAAACVDHWVGTWATAPSDAIGGRALRDQTARMVISPHLAGDVVRVHLSNRPADAPATLGPLTVGTVASGASVVPGTLRRLTFGGSATVTIPAHGDVVSDPVALHVEPFAHLAVSMAVPGEIARPSEHFITRQTNYLTPAESGDHAADADGAAFTETTATTFSNGWWYLSGVDVRAAGTTGAVVAIGSSITDGVQTQPDGTGEQLGNLGQDTRWPDALSRRLLAAGIPLSPLNLGISGNRVLADGAIPIYGPSVESRFDRDALRQAGATTVVVAAGGNDLGQSAPGAPTAQLIAGYERLVARAHAAGLRVVLGTITPNANVTTGAYASDAAQAGRTAVNTWIRTQAVADGIADFDAAVRDPDRPHVLRADYDDGDHLHLTPAGYEAMAAAVPLDALARPACPTTPAPASGVLPARAAPAAVAPDPSLVVRLRARRTARGALVTVTLRGGSTGLARLSLVRGSRIVASRRAGVRAGRATVTFRVRRGGRYSAKARVGTRVSRSTEGVTLP